MRRFFAATLAIFGLLTGLWGGGRLLELASIYRSTDLVVSESPATFRDWVSDMAVPERDDERDAVVARIASRLVTMPLDHRRNLVAAMLRPAYWMPFARDGRSSNVVRALVLDGIMKALVRAPTAGDLYVAAAWLRTGTQGYDSADLKLIDASRLFAPRETPLAEMRLRFAAITWPQLGDVERASFRTDMSVLQTGDPQSAAILARDFAASGIVLQ